MKLILNLTRNACNAYVRPPLFFTVLYLVSSYECEQRSSLRKQTDFPPVALRRRKSDCFRRLTKTRFLLNRTLKLPDTFIETNMFLQSICFDKITADKSAWKNVTITFSSSLFPSGVPLSVQLKGCVHTNSLKYSCSWCFYRHMLQFSLNKANSPH